MDSSFKDFSTKNPKCTQWICYQQPMSSHLIHMPSFYNNKINFRRLIHELKTTPIHSMQSSLSKLATPTSNPMTPNQTFRSQHQQRLLSQSKKRESRSNDNCILTLNTCFERLNQSLDIVIEKAKSLFYDSEYKECMDILEK